jgi:hypothetical protein
MAMLVAVRPAWRAFGSVIVMTVALSLTPTIGKAQVLGTWAPAIPEPTDSYKAGAFLIFGEPFGLVGQFRTGIDTNWDVGIQLGVPDFDAFGDRALVGIAGDVKYLILPEDEDFDFDMALDFAFGWQHAEDFNLVDFDFGALASKTVTTDGGETLIPYGALMLAIGRASVDTPGGDFSDTELDVNVRLGLDWPIKSDVDFLSELNLSSRDETLSISAGLMLGL